MKPRGSRGYNILQCYIIQRNVTYDVIVYSSLYIYVYILYLLLLFKFLIEKVFLLFHTYIIFVYGLFIYLFRRNEIEKIKIRNINDLAIKRAGMTIQLCRYSINN